MKLAEILSGRAGNAFTAPTKRVKFKAIGKDAQGSQIIADVEAKLSFVSETARGEARIAAEKAIRKEFPDGNAPPGVLSDETIYQILTRALRDADDVRQPFVMTAQELKNALHQQVAADLFRQYGDFCAEEFPETVDEETFEKLVEEAKKKSLYDLLSQFGYSQIQRAVPSLALKFGTFPTPTSGDGEPVSRPLSD